MAVMEWDVRGYHAGESFTKPGGAFITAMQNMANETAVDWLHKIGPQIRDEAKELCPIGATGLLRKSIYDRYNDKELYCEIGSDKKAAGDRVYLIYVELGANGRAGEHMLSRALTNVMGKL